MNNGLNIVNENHDLQHGYKIRWKGYAVQNKDLLQSHCWKIHQLYSRWGISVKRQISQ